VIHSLEVTLLETIKLPQLAVSLRGLTLEGGACPEASNLTVEQKQPSGSGWFANQPSCKPVTGQTAEDNVEIIEES
jgi:hypothetical protein